MQLLPKKNKRLITMEELELPEEIVLVQILSRLPVKSLLRCRCVCKHWRDWISGPQFKFLTQRRRILIFSRSHDYLDPSFSFPCIDEEDASVQSIPEPWDGEYNPNLYNLLGSCNGFVLIGLGRTILLWNPSTRASKEVLQHKNLLCCYSKMYAMSGLCYDSSTNDYKVILRFDGLPGKPFEFSSLRKKCWTKVNDDVSSNYFPIWGQSKGAVVNGNQHWLVKKKLKNEEDKKRNKFEEAIIYFDGGSEKLSEIPIPILLTTGGAGAGGYCCGLGQMDGCLALGRQSDGKTTIEIWVLKDYNVQKESSWTLCFTCPVYIELNYRCNLAMQPLCITKDGGGEVLMVKDRNEILAYSPKKEEYRSIHTSRFVFFSIEVAEYVESLVSPSAVTRPDLMER